MHNSHINRTSNPDIMSVIQGQYVDSYQGMKFVKFVFGPCMTGSRLAPIRQVLQGIAVIIPGYAILAGFESTHEHEADLIQMAEMILLSRLQYRMQVHSSVDTILDVLFLPSRQ